MVKPRAFLYIGDCCYCLFANDYPMQFCLARGTAPEGDRCLNFRSMHKWLLKK
ncbi:hypothetical protein [Synechococcus elongatus]|uniref:Uncharacterized protein n=2 Tax=Synechococcus elongatus TaxID=32046 RepID=Q31MX9_SYNE7|nr:hypothetical protein [Synechococcus elongatus]ABB57590.1 conserved hypothetical protein [Synechococcus elongatus PCC 7942 = FACHB-805]MBD2588392.1 hypothetical protein [Synechococcus elongatus FACHB-242]MBD2689445.1 hypothetical protein [Synechococcus elongatus FACHB-1061]MBD2708136.1 hypothetical protein [Synechococcus elongatus PCC 7942 = FACHB-805]WKW04552.1 hypothetical protein QY054_08105 [Synechococcus elongatus PCC 7942 = FACHB-805]